VKYINDLHEMIPTPPYWLGVGEQHMQCHSFSLKSTRAALQNVVNEQLNAALGWDGTGDPFDPPYGEVKYKTADDDGTELKIRYIVPASIKRVALVFYRYWRAETYYKTQPLDQGWTQYTEVFLQFIVKRQIEGLSGASDARRFVAAIYIDDATWLKPVTDAQAMPIVIGREAYGLPKAPGEIYYCTDDVQIPGFLRLKIWDNPDAGEVVLTDAIYSGSPAPAPGSCGDAPPDATATDPDDPSRDDEAALLFGLDGGGRELRSRLTREIPPVFLERLPRADLPSARILRLEDEEDLLVLDDLSLYTKLLGLKQFPDPTTSGAGAGHLEACYQAFVESPIEKPTDGVVHGGVLNPQEIHFVPTIHRVDYVTALGLEGPDIVVPETDIRWQRGRLVFGNPQRTEVFELQG
jgi:hypothetical protein